MNINSSKSVPSHLIEVEKYRQRRLDMCDRLFESIVIDLKLLISGFENNDITQETFTREILRLSRQILMFSPKGEVRTLIARATSVIIDGVTKDMNQHIDENLEETIGPFPQCKNQNKNVPDYNDDELIHL